MLKGMRRTHTHILTIGHITATACSEWEGIYVLYNYAAKRQTAKNIQLVLSKPEAGSEGKVMRHLTFFKC